MAFPVFYHVIIANVRGLSLCLIATFGDAGMNPLTQFVVDSQQGKYYPKVISD
jgi:hypothetical protein